MFAVLDVPVIVVTQIWNHIAIHVLDGLEPHHCLARWRY
jgi:hypothetical protein